MIEIKTEDAPKAVGPYSQGVICNDTIYVSGQIPINPADGTLITDYEKACIQIFENIKNILLEANSSLSNIIKTTIFIKDIKSFDIVNKVYASYFSIPYPARSCVEVSNLPKGAILEIEVIARR